MLGGWRAGSGGERAEQRNGWEDERGAEEVLVAGEGQEDEDENEEEQDEDKEVKERR